MFLIKHSETPLRTWVSTQKESQAAAGYIVDNNLSNPAIGKLGSNGGSASSSKTESLPTIAKSRLFAMFLRGAAKTQSWLIGSQTKEEFTGCT
jgi:hypothetical protein